MKSGLITINLNQREYPVNGVTLALQKKEIQKSLAEKLMTLFFWDDDEIILVDFISNGTTIT